MRTHLVYETHAYTLSIGDTRVHT